MQINITYDQATNTLPAGFTAAMQRVVTYLDNEFTNNVTLDLHVGNGEQNGNLIGAGFEAQNSAAHDNILNYSNIRQDLVNAATSTDDQTSTQNLPTTDPISGTHDWWVDDLEQRALGIGSGNAVGYLGFEVAGSTYIGASSTDYAVVGIADYNSDGTSDILFMNHTTGDTGFYQIVNGANAGWHGIGVTSTSYHVAS